MITQEVISYPVIPYKKLNPSSVDEFLDTFEDVLDLDLENGMDLEFMIDSKMGNNKISPVLVLAKPWDAEELAALCREVYEGTYPYKEIEDANEVRKMIESPEHHFILFKVGEIVAGCYRCSLDFKLKRAFTGGFMVKKEYQKRLDVTKASIGCYAWMFSTFKEILVWYCENRTAHGSSQYTTSICGLTTLAYFPNKDVFYNKVESDLLSVVYQEKALNAYRERKTPTLIRNALDCFLHSDNIYGLGSFNLVSPDLTLDYEVISELHENFRKDVITDKYGYKYYQFFLSGTKSYFNFLHTPSIQNIEKTKYHIDTLEELYIYLEEFLKIMKENSIRYSEVFVSALYPEHQQLFYEFGFRARGYVPCWSYSEKEKALKDYVVFNYYEGEVPQAELLPESQDLVDILNLQINV